MTLLVRRGIDEVLAEARRRMDRLSPREALAAQQRGAVLVDIRPQQYRDIEGSVPGALIVDRNVLEWRFDPSSEAHLDMAAYDLAVVVFCNEGYTSSLAAAALLDLGVHATDLIGGYRAWRAAGLPTLAATPEWGDPISVTDEVNAPAWAARRTCR
jgi:rhodanese-related sulfurtransferase